MCTPCSDQNEFPIGKCNPEDGKNASKKVPTTAKLSSPSARPPTRPAIEFNAMMVPNVTDGRRIITQQDMMVQSAMADAGNAFDVNAIDALSWTMGGVLRYGKNQKWVNIIKKGDVIIPPPINQYHCGSCWACSTAVALGARYAVALAKVWNTPVKALIPSTANLVSCSQVLNIKYDQQTGKSVVEPCDNKEYAICPSNTCDVGGNVQVAALWLSGDYPTSPNGKLHNVEYPSNPNQIGTESCWPYDKFFHLPLTDGRESPSRGVVNDSAPPSTNRPPPCIMDRNCCYDCCGTEDKPNPNSIVKFSVLPGSVVAYSLNSNFKLQDLITAMKHDIYDNGPLCTQFLVPKNFSAWFASPDRTKDSVYDPAEQLSPNSTSLDVWAGGHAVVIVGWGKNEKGDYWEVQNSWGVDFAGSGIYRIAMSKEGDEGRWLGIDAPTFYGNQSFGGAVRFLPNIYPDKMRRSTTDDEKNRTNPGLWNRQINAFISKGYILDRKKNAVGVGAAIKTADNLKNYISRMAAKGADPRTRGVLSTLVHKMSHEDPIQALSLVKSTIATIPNAEESLRRLGIKAAADATPLIQTAKTSKTSKTSGGGLLARIADFFKRIFGQKENFTPSSEKANKRVALEKVAIACFAVVFLLIILFCNGWLPALALPK
jgi:hypothetical protein